MANINNRNSDDNATTNNIRTTGRPVAKRSLRRVSPRDEKYRVTSRETNSRSNPNRSYNRPNPMIPKAGFTRSGRRSFENGGKVD